MEKSLWEYEKKNVNIVCVDGEEYYGFVEDYIFPDENDDGIEMIVLNLKGFSNPIGFKTNEIKSIEII